MLNLATKFFKQEIRETSYNEYWERKNSSIVSLLDDFPWLWAIKNCWSAHDTEYVKVSQDISDLKAILMRKSKETRFSVWLVISQLCKINNMKIRLASAQENSIWAEDVLRGLKGHDPSILYVVLSDPIFGEDHSTRRVTIFRNPGKRRFNELVRWVSEMHGLHSS